MSALFTPFSLRSLAIANRVAVSPMCQYWAVDGKANAWHMMHLGGLANSGAGMLFIEATAVEAIGCITPGDFTAARWKIACVSRWKSSTQYERCFLRTSQWA